jgi:lipopolysaccharide export LptBFGC system permease protein LptF
MFDKNKKHGFVVVEYTGNGMMYLKNGNEYEGVISRSKSAIVINNDGTWSVIGRRDYKIIHDLRAPVKIGEEAEFSDDGKNW